MKFMKTIIALRTKCTHNVTTITQILLTTFQKKKSNTCSFKTSST